MHRKVAATRLSRRLGNVLSAFERRGGRSHIFAGNGSAINVGKGGTNLITDKSRLFRLARQTC